MSASEADTLAALQLLYKKIRHLKDKNIRDLLQPDASTDFRKTLDEAYDALVLVEDTLDGLGMRLEYHHWQIMSALEELTPLLIQPRTQAADALDEEMRRGEERHQGYSSHRH